MTKVYILESSRPKEWYDCPELCGIYSSEDEAKKARDTYIEKWKNTSRFPEGIEFDISEWELDAPVEED